MRKRMDRHLLLSLGICAIFAVELLLIADGIVVYGGGMLPLYSPVLMVPVAALLFFLCFHRDWKKALAVTAAIPVLMAVAAGAGYIGWKSFSVNAVYENPDSGKHQIYGDRNVMVIVPHQDDELNILGGVLEEYVKYGSEVRIVFVTNGDYVVPAEVRFDEALSVAEYLGIPEDHVIFLGYGNEWSSDSPHLYNGEPGKIYESHAGKTATYGIATHAAYREGRTYTRENFEEDLKSVILEYTPEIVFCSDYDHHIDHKAVSLLFEKVMGWILKENPSYRPVVYKGYAYGTAWEAEMDYYADNVLATKNPFVEPYGQRPEIYRWEDRIRMPIAGDTLSRSIISAPAYQTLALHKKQGTTYQAGRVINGDKVFWERNTESLVLCAGVSASSGNAALLHDFMLTDNHNLVDAGHHPYDGVWIPEPEDTTRTVSVELEELSDISEIVLYDHPSDIHNVCNAAIVFDDGSRVETGALDPLGAATRISVDKKNVSGFSVSLLETEGDMAGLSEIEAFQDQAEKDGSFIKLMDREGNFAYDYRTASDGLAEFTLYVHGNLPEITAEKYSVETAWDIGVAELNGNTIRVYCPEGENVVLNVTCDAAGVSDSIVIRNPGTVARKWMELWEETEEAFYSRFSDGTFDQLLVYRICKKVSYVIRHI